MTTSAVDDSVLKPSSPTPENGHRAPVSQPATTDTNVDPAVDDECEEIDRYFQKLMERTNQRPTTSASDPPPVRQAPTKEPSDDVASNRSPSPLQPPAATKPQSPPPPDTDSHRVTEKPAGAETVASALLARSADVVDVFPAKPPSANFIAADQEDPLEATRQPLDCDLSAMREVANTSARLAIAVHGSKQVEQRAYMYLAVTVVTVLVSAGLYAITPSYLTLSGIVATLTLTLSLGLACRSQLLFRRARRALTSTPNSEPE